MFLNSALKYAGRHLLTRRYSVACALLAAFCFLAAPAWPQDGGTACVTPGALVPPTNSLGDFYSNFVANGKLATYGIPLNPATGQNDAGDRNSTYFPLYYSNTNLQSWMRSNLQSPGAGAQVGGLP
jgi:hypothetical protein